MLRFCSIVGLCALTIVAPLSGASAKVKLKVLHTFTGLTGGGDGANPVAGLIADKKGNLYGTTPDGGKKNAGTVYKLARNGAYAVLYSFTGGTDGSSPEAGLIADKHSNLYGTTNGGGAHTYYGTVFKLTPDGSETVLYSFAGGNDGSHPDADLITDAAGNLYGTTRSGGGSGCLGNGCGTVFKLAPDGTETVLYSFTGSDAPYTVLIADKKGDLYGTSYYGGEHSTGAVFKIAPDGTFTILHSFTGGDGSNPEGGLIADEQGNLYGTTRYGGKDNDGTVFELAPDGTETVLYSFTGGMDQKDGWEPFASLIADSDGNLYGTTRYGGKSGDGTVFKIAPNGGETLLYSFTGDKDGAQPVAGLIADGSGNLYGTAEDGGANKDGTVFEILAKKK